VRYKAFISYSHAADGKLAPALESALRKFAKPWYRPRSVKVFRDQTNLSASPGLWSSIEKALNESEYFLLLASRPSAGSQWVRREVDHWLKHRSPQKLLIILTDGEVVWDARGGDFDWNKTNALPENLAKAFTEEPLYLDFRWANTAEDLSLNNPRFLDQIAALASPLHGRPKEDLIGEDVLEHRRTKRWAWSAAIVLVILTSLFGLSALIALDQKNEADRQSAQALGLQLAAQAEAKRIQQPNLLQASVADAVKAMRQSYSDAAYKTLQVGLKLLPTPAGGEKHDDNVTAVVFSPDGRLVATASYDHTSLIFEVPARRKAAPL
jgi:TIR domain-containing protein/WD40 domain-containing protein